jgi:CrcB protein
VSALAWVAVAAVGGLGALARFLLDAVVSERAGGELPWGTLAVNISGAFVLGLVVGLPLRGDALLIAGAGALGSYTTFSTWMLESHRLGEEGELPLGIINVAASLIAGVGAAAIGRAIGGAL